MNKFNYMDKYINIIIQYIIMFINELNELENIIDTILPEDEIYFLNEEEQIELYDTCIHLMETYIEEHPKAITEPDFLEVFEENIKDIIFLHNGHLLFTRILVVI